MRQHKGETLILSYHRVLPKSHPEYNNMQPGMVVTDDTFRNHMKWLTKYLEIVRLADLKRESKPSNQPKCVITLDDGWVDNYTYAFSILKEFKIPATIFLVSNMIGTNHYFWPEKLGILLNNKITKELLTKKIKVKYGSEIINYNDLIELLKSKNDESIIEILDEVTKEAEKTDNFLNENRQILNIEEIKNMSESGLIEYGSHTANHIRLDKVPLMQSIRELTESKKQLESLLDTNISTFCYPNGSYTSDVVEEVSKNYDIACTTDKGWVDTNSDMHRLKRIMLHDDISNTKSLFWGRVLEFF